MNLSASHRMHQDYVSASRTPDRAHLLEEKARYTKGQVATLSAPVRCR